MSLIKPPKKAMREYYLKPPASGSTTAYICHQTYDRSSKRTVQTLVASFNIATDPASPSINVTNKGRAVGYAEVLPQHRADVQQWLKKHGTFGQTKVPAKVLARVRAEVEAKLRLELAVSATPGPQMQTATAPSAAKRQDSALRERMRAMCAATEDARRHLASVATGGLKVLGLTEDDLFELRVHLNFGEKAVRKMLKTRGLSARDHARTALPDEAAEAARRGIALDDPNAASAKRR